MTKLTQNKLGIGNGNCLITSIACILDYTDAQRDNIDFDTSDFLGMIEKGTPHHEMEKIFYHRLYEKMESIGYDIINIKYISYLNFKKKENTQYHFLPWNCHCILSFPTVVPNHLHAIIGYINNYREISPVWDPDPESPGHNDITFWNDKMPTCKAIDFIVKK